MASLPEVGGDVGVWGTELNDFLEVAHNPDGTLKGGLVGSTGPTGPVGPTGPGGGAGTQGLDGLDSTFLPVAPLAISGQTPSQNPSILGTTNVGSLAVAARADHIHASSGLFHWLGNGSDGAAVFDGTAVPTGSIKESSTLYYAGRNLNFSSMSINSGITLDMCGYKLRVNGTIVGPSGSAATITCASLGVAGGTNNSVAAGPNTQLTNSGARPMPLRGGTFGSNGGTTTGTNTGYQSSGPYQFPLGGIGGTGSSGAGGSVDAGADNTLNYDWQDFVTATEGWSTTFDQSNPSNGASIIMLWGGQGGSGGGGDGTNAGGAGGAGGNIVIANCKIITGNINLTAPGAPGGIPTTGNVGGGGGGSGGVVCLNTTDLSTWTGTVTAAGGIGGSGHGTGSAGAAGATGVALATQWS